MDLKVGLMMTKMARKIVKQALKFCINWGVTGKLVDDNNEG